MPAVVRMPACHSRRFKGERRRHRLTEPTTKALRQHPPPPKTKVTIVGKNGIYRWENLIGPFLEQKFWVPDPPPLPRHLIPPPPPEWSQRTSVPAPHSVHRCSAPSVHRLDAPFSRAL